MILKNQADLSETQIFQILSAYLTNIIYKAIHNLIKGSYAIFEEWN